MQATASLFQQRERRPFPYVAGISWYFRPELERVVETVHCACYSSAPVGTQLLSAAFIPVTRPSLPATLASFLESRTWRRNRLCRPTRMEVHATRLIRLLFSEINEKHVIKISCFLPSTTLPKIT
ncbi:hypothetical protein [Burkholderia cenocepacia]|uniref:hypothetical protein n=1 Tax=Burkholderia cenocepacia TaxID=95486 RepID=UPI002AB31294|nr:hypothetical protein [Burkholderia cenocepacia]